jgi:hypothetical protein
MIHSLTEPVNALISIGIGNIMNTKKNILIVNKKKKFSDFVRERFQSLKEVNYGSYLFLWKMK